MYDEGRFRNGRECGNQEKRKFRDMRGKVREMYDLRNLWKRGETETFRLDQY